MTDVVIASALRTPIGSFMGSLSSVPAPKLGAVAIKGAIEAAGVDASSVDEVLMGCVLQAGLGQAPARQAAIYAGVPNSVGATTIHKVCGSGLKTVILGSQIIRAGDADVIVDSQNGPITVAGMSKNDVVGEIAILCDVPRTATVRATSDLTALKISKDLFFRLVTEFPQMAVEIMRVLAARLNTTTAQLMQARQQGG